MNYSGANSNRPTPHTIKRLEELKIPYDRDTTWLEAKKLIKEYHQKKAAERRAREAKAQN